MYKPRRADIEAEVQRHGRENNPKWDNEIWGYEQFHQDQKDFLYEMAEKQLITNYILAEAARVARAEYMLERDMPNAHLKYRNKVYRMLLEEWDTLSEYHREAWIEKTRPTVFAVMRELGWHDLV